MSKLFKTLALFALLPALVIASCNKSDPNALRAERIDIYTSLDDPEPIEEAFFSVLGGTTTFFMKSNVQGLSVKWQDGKTPAWAKVDKIVAVSDDTYAITMTCDPITARTDTVDASGNSIGLYQKRAGNLLITKADQFIGKYFVVYQGFTKRLGTDFNWLEYGSDNPNENIGEVSIDNWTAQEKSRGYTSTRIEGQEETFCYGKNGYIRLGNKDRFGADFKIPYVNNFSYDSLLVVSFKAVHQIGYTTGELSGETEGIGTETIKPYDGSSASSAPLAVGEDEKKSDNDILTLEVTGGGAFRMTDGTTPTTLTLHIGTYDQKSSKYPQDIFKGAGYLAFICSTPTNPISSNTVVRFIAGSMDTDPMVTPNRIFLDDLYIYRMVYKSDEDLFEMNGRVSGTDKIFGGR